MPARKIRAAVAGAPVMRPCGRWIDEVAVRRTSGGTNFIGDTMSELEIILILMTFVIPAVFILADDRMWQRKKN
jgi:hypothetical protein